MTTQQSLTSIGQLVPELPVIDVVRAQHTIGMHSAL